MNDERRIVSAHLRFPPKNHRLRSFGIQAVRLKLAGTIKILLLNSLVSQFEPYWKTSFMEAFISQVHRWGKTHGGDGRASRRLRLSQGSCPAVGAVDSICA